MKTTLHYIYDPLCGWCYGAAPLVRAARSILHVQPHGGGMMIGERRRAVTPQLREFVMPHDARIARLSGQRFGERYFDGLLLDTSAVFDSAPPTAAVLAAEAMAGRGLDMLMQLQTAHYVGGHRIAERAVLIDVAAAIGLDRISFAQALDRLPGRAVQTHINQTRAFMDKVGTQSFPTFVLETGRGLQIVDFSDYLGHPQEFQDMLRNRIVSPPTAHRSNAFACEAHGCSA